MSAATAWLATALATVLAWVGVFKVTSGPMGVALAGIVSIAIVVVMAWWLGARAITSIALACGVGCSFGWSGNVVPDHRTTWWTLSIFVVLVVGAVVGYFVAAGAVSRRGPR